MDRGVQLYAPRGDSWVANIFGIGISPEYKTVTNTNINIAKKVIPNVMNGIVKLPFITVVLRLGLRLQIYMSS